MGLVGKSQERVAAVPASPSADLAVSDRGLQTADVAILRGLELIGLGLLALITGSRREPWRETEAERR